MADFLLAVLAEILLATPFLVILIAAAINMKKPDRVRQFFMPVLAFVYVIGVLIFAHKICDGFLELIQSLPDWLKELKGFSWFPQGLTSTVDWLAGVFKNFFEQLKISFWLFYTINLLMIFAFLIFKKIVIAIFKKIFMRDRKLMEKLTKPFYEYFSDRGVWCLKKNQVEARNYLCVLYGISVVILCILVIVCHLLYLSNAFSAVFYPVLGAIIIGEIFFFFGGCTRQEYLNSFKGENENSHHRVNYSLLRKFLRSLFGDKLNCENTTINSGSDYGYSNDELIETLSRDEDPKIETFGIFIKGMNEKRVSLDHNNVRSAIELLKGNSILFNNPFYYDMIPYAFYPMNRVLLEHKKVLVVLGRHAIEDGIVEWLQDGIGAVTNIPEMWNIKVLSEEGGDDIDIGIITRSNVANMNLHNANSAFLGSVGFFVIIEPSRLVATSQLGLNLIIKQCRTEGNNDIVFCMCDKNCDGLVDAMSHILMTSITEVSATGKHLGSGSYMGWNADGNYLHHRLFPNVSRYLGLGAELSFVGLKNQVSKVYWYGGEAFPVTDMNWIDRQYYYELMSYAGLPANQKYMEDVFITSAGYWDARKNEYNYITAEDENYNLFEVIRDFSTRSSEQGFVNVISDNYLLRDYMASNQSVFETDSKAIPYICADYARTNRNVTLRLLLLMSSSGISEESLIKEFSLIGNELYAYCEQLWYEIYKCFASVCDVSKLASYGYREAVEKASQEKIELPGLEPIGIEIISVKTSFNFHHGRYENIYWISDKDFINSYVCELRSAGYIAEDEKGEKYYLGSELKSHIFQKYLPGQFFTFGGKYYEMQNLTADNQILVRRAADHIYARSSYRQIRDYELLGFGNINTIGASRIISGIHVVKQFADITVSTSGYYKMTEYNDFETAKKVVFDESSSIPKRHYKNKELIRIDFPTDKPINDRVRYTITLLMNEIFRTLFADNQSYLAAVTDMSFISDDEDCNPLTCSVHSSSDDYCVDSIYILEDSQIDLGLIIAVERNLGRIFDIINDYIDWHLCEIKKSLVSKEDKNTLPIPVKEDEITDETEIIRKGVFVRFVERIKKVFSQKKEIGNETESIEQTTNNQESKKHQSLKPQRELFKKKLYHTGYYLMFGTKGEPAMLDILGTGQYISRIFNNENNTLKQVRKGRHIAKIIEKGYRPKLPGTRYCDFCGVELLGVEFETLADGRDRCINCSRTSVKTLDELIRIFESVKRNMESSFGIRFDADIHVEMVNAKTLEKESGRTFIPSKKFDPRVVGLALNRNGKFRLLIENGAPRIRTILTIAHELTHIWQYINWKEKHIRNLYGKDLLLEIYEGMAKWVEIQYAYLINEIPIAKREEIITAYRSDEYGRGFLRYRLNYQLSTGTVITGPTPFMNPSYPLSLDYCGEISIPEEFLNDPVTEAEVDVDDDDVFIDMETPDIYEPVFEGSHDRNPNMLSYYAYDHLSEVDKEIYNLFYQAILNREKSVHLDDSQKITKEHAEMIADAVFHEHPELIWVRNVIGCNPSDINEHQDFFFYYDLSPEESERRMSQIETAASVFTEGITDEMCDFEVVLRVYNRLIELVDYDSLGLEEEETHKKENDSSYKVDDLRSVYGILVNRKGVCAGYAIAFAYLLQKLGIECMYVSGKTRKKGSKLFTEPHAWNLIRLENEYYYIDVTWGDSSNTKPEKNMSDEISYDYFCITSDELAKDHKIDETFPYPECTATACNYFVRMGLYFENYSFEDAKNVALKTVMNHEKIMQIKYSNEDELRKAQNELVDNNRFYDIIQEANLKLGESVCSSRYKYSVIPERYIIRFYFSYLN